VVGAGGWVPYFAPFPVHQSRPRKKGPQTTPARTIDAKKGEKRKRGSGKVSGGPTHPVLVKVRPKPFAHFLLGLISGQNAEGSGRGTIIDITSRQKKGRASNISPLKLQPWGWKGGQGSIRRRNTRHCSLVGRVEAGHSLQDPGRYISTKRAGNPYRLRQREKHGSAAKTRNVKLKNGRQAYSALASKCRGKETKKSAESSSHPGS